AGAGERTHFLTINLLPLRDAARRTHAVLFLVDDNTTDITIRKELIAANTAKDEFLALLSHELRNPLSPVITMVHELEKIATEEKLRTPLEIIRRNDERRRLIIEVSDTGLGIDPERLGKIFNAFEQGESSITRRFGGLGLGLAISKAMIEAHGGRLTAHSAGRGQGATFVIEIDTI